VTDRVFIIGAGKVGRGLTRAFRASGVTVIGLHARRPHDEASSSGDYPPTIADANVILIAVRDAEIDGVCRTLAELARVHPSHIAHGAAILHTSGTADPPTFPQLRALGLNPGTFHPLVPFATPERGAQLLKDAWVGIEGDPNACAAARRLAAAVGARTMNIPASQKALYHAAAVMASNFPIVLAGLASRLLTNAGVVERTADQVIQSLMRAAITNLDYGTPAEVLTGPVVRNDTTTIETHQRALQQDPDALAAYKALTQAARTLRKAGVERPRHKGVAEP
jgi:predicted short-subunit dehydrogenase-like oxidoreductase (DUF2520 family)